MCIAVATAAFALQAGTAALGLIGQVSEASANKAYQQQLADARNEQVQRNAEIARNSYERQTAALNAQAIDADRSDGQSILDNAIRSLTARSTALVAAEEAGVTGLSVRSLLDDFRAQEARFKDATLQNNQALDRQIAARKDAALAQAEGRIASIPQFQQAPVKAPDFFGAALRIGHATAVAHDAGVFDSIFKSTPAPVPTPDREIIRPSF